MPFFVFLFASLFMFQSHPGHATPGSRDNDIQAYINGTTQFFHPTYSVDGQTFDISEDSDPNVVCRVFGFDYSEPEKILYSVSRAIRPALRFFKSEHNQDTFEKVDQKSPMPSITCKKKDQTNILKNTRLLGGIPLEPLESNGEKNELSVKLIVPLVQYADHIYAFTFASDLKAVCHLFGFSDNKLGTANYEKLELETMAHDFQFNFSREHVYDAVFIKDLISPYKYNNNPTYQASYEQPQSLHRTNYWVSEFSGLKHAYGLKLTETPRHLVNLNSQGKFEDFFEASSLWDRPPYEQRWNASRKMEDKFYFYLWSLECEATPEQWKKVKQKYDKHLAYRHVNLNNDEIKKSKKRGQDCVVQ